MCANCLECVSRPARQVATIIRYLRLKRAGAKFLPNRLTAHAHAHVWLSTRKLCVHAALFCGLGQTGERGRGRFLRAGLVVWCHRTIGRRSKPGRLCVYVRIKDQTGQYGFCVFAGGGGGGGEFCIITNRETVGENRLVITTRTHGH